MGYNSVADIIPVSLFSFV